jgi:hydroxyacyl-ACP dehydratase HTD2-like protein with hotdog domain
MSAGLALSDIGLVAETTSELSADHAVQVGATLNTSSTPGRGEPLPLLWHWAYFTPTAASSALGTDGHPVLPPGPVSAYPRRMWASGSVESTTPLVLGSPATRVSSILSSKETDGRSGALFIVRVEHRYRQFDVDCVTEEQTLVYRKPGPPTLLPAGDQRPEATEGQWTQRHTPDTKSLFRFSSITFNSHRIHYDEPYATGVEGYPALVVHGPLTALLVAESIRSQFHRDLGYFEFRASAPLFADAPFTIIGTPGAPITARVVRNDGAEAMSVTAQLARPS